MDIPLRASVYCDNELVGHVSKLVLNPVTKDVTHLVVRPKGALHTERLVSLETISQTGSDRVDLNCTRGELERLEPYLETSFIQVDVPDYHSIDYVTFPHVELEHHLLRGVHEHIQAGELSIRYGTPVKAEDGRVGWVDAFVVNPDSGHITHLVVLQRHGLGKDDVTVPVSAIRKVEETSVLLSLTKAEVAKLKHVSVKRRKKVTDPVLGE